jgi:CRISPR-associated exonuclease Cas4
MTPTAWIAAGVVLAVLLGLLLILNGKGMRRPRGLGAGRTLALDNSTFISRRYQLAGRPDRLVSEGGALVPEEWKSSHTVRPWHRAQLGVYFLLIEEELRIRPPHGFIVCGDGTRHLVENTEDLRAWVLEVADQIRAARRRIAEPIQVQPKPGQCRPCGMRGHCRQARLD